MAGKRGFISAPLIGSVIFLAAVIFIVNLQNVEASASLRIANDAYHNRVSSVLEEYRSDLASIFREGLSRTISFYLLKPGWSEFTWSNNPNQQYYAYDEDVGAASSLQIDANGNGKLELKELKKAKCESVKRITSDIMCSLSTSSDATYAYGLPQWMKHFENALAFEGIRFETSNVDQMKVFYPQPDPATGSFDPDSVDDYVEACRALLKGSVFDCGNFADALETASDPQKFKCRDPDTGQEIDGCEAGTFYVKVSVDNAIVDPSLPRVGAEDQGGNLVRSSGISDKDFYLPINLRIFKYYDETFKVYARLSYGASEANRDEQQSEGVEQGHCGGNDCLNTDEYNDQGYALSGVDLTNENDVKLAVSNRFYNQVLIPACNKINSPVVPVNSNFVLKACPTTGDCDGLPEAGLDCNDATVETIIQQPEVKTCPTSSPGLNLNQCALYGGGTLGAQNTWGLNFKLIDNNPAYNIDPAEPVVFNWGVSLQHYP